MFRIKNSIEKSQISTLTKNNVNVSNSWFLSTMKILSKLSYLTVTILFCLRSLMGSFIDLTRTTKFFGLKSALLQCRSSVVVLALAQLLFQKCVVPKRRRQRVYSCRFLTSKFRSRPRFGSTVVLEMCCAQNKTITRLQLQI